MFVVVKTRRIKSSPASGVFGKRAKTASFMRNEHNWILASGDTFSSVRSTCVPSAQDVYLILNFGVAE